MLSLIMPIPDSLLAELLERGPLLADGRPSGQRAHVGLLVQDAESGEVLWEHQPNASFTPASTTKALTTAAALYTLGPQFRFSTTLLATAVQTGRVQRLTLRGSGDPSLRPNGRGNSLAALAEAAAAYGVQKVDELRVDDFALTQPRWGRGWMWDDPAPCLGGLQLDDDAHSEVRLSVDAANQSLLTRPDALPLSVGAELAAQLAARGVRVAEVCRAKAEPTDLVLAEVHSPPLSELISRTNKPSHNRYAEQLRAALGLGRAGEPSSEARVNAALGGFFQQTGSGLHPSHIVDGSGLSRYNLLSPRQLSTVLRYAYLHPLDSSLTPAAAYRQHRNSFVESLAVAGTGEATPQQAERGGTLRQRLVGSGLDVRAKTGSMTGVSALGGYLTTSRDRVLVFSFLMDHYPGETSDLSRWQDTLLLALAARY